jgi:phospholipase C
MGSSYRSLWWALSAGAKRNRLRRNAHLTVETLEDRRLMSGAPFDHVLLLSVDGLHQADVADPVLQAATNPINHLPVLKNIIGAENQGVTYANAFTPVPSDSGPGTQAEITGAHPGTTGYFYDDSYDRNLFPPAYVGSHAPGTPVVFSNNLDYNTRNLSSTDGTRGFDATAIDPTQLPLSAIFAVDHDMQNGIVASASTTVFHLTQSPVLNDGTAAGSIFVGSSHTLLATFTIPHADPNPALPNSANDFVPLHFTNGGSNFSQATLNISSGVLTLTWSILPPPTHTSLDNSYNYGTPVYPHDFIHVNTIFNVAHDAGLPTAYSDKHPSYDSADGPSGDGVDDLYSPEVNSFAALKSVNPVDPHFGHTIDANALRDQIQMGIFTPFADMSNYELVYALTDPDGPNDPNLGNITFNVLLAIKYDELKVQAIVNEIGGLDATGTRPAPVPALFGMNFQAVSIAQKYSKGGIDSALGVETPSNLFLDALQHADAGVGRMEDALKAHGLWHSTMMIVTAKHGQAPRIDAALRMADTQLPNVIGPDLVAHATQDDVSLFWLKDQTKTAAAVAALKTFKASGFVTGNDAANNPVTLPASQVIDTILYGQALQDYQLGDPAQNSRTPDIIVTLKPGFIWVANPTNRFKRAEHGGFSADDSHVVLIVSSGGLNPNVQGSVQDGPVETTQIAVTTLKALGLNPTKLQGAHAEGTQELPGLNDDALRNINHFIVIYQENWSFDGLYGSFPGANGVPSGTPVFQVDKNGNPLTTLPDPSTDPTVPGGLPMATFDLTQYVPPNGHTGDIVHRYYTEQLQIDNGKIDTTSSTNSNNRFVTWSDNKSMVLSQFDATNLPEGLLAQQYTINDNFFHAAYGGSFLNHQFLVAAAAPQWNQAFPVGVQFQSTYDPATKALNDSNLTIDGRYDVNTTFGAQAPHPGVPSDQLLNVINDNHPFMPDGTPDPTYTPTIGDLLDTAAGGAISWKWYSGGWNDALRGQAAPLFQYHHQPFAYYANYAPFNADGTPNAQTDVLLNPNAHLQDETRFFDDLSHGTLPAVSFVKPLGPDNEHPGYADLLRGQQHVADIVHAAQNSPDWAHTAIIITYDENGGRWDHVSPPNNNGIWGDGARVPTIVISPYAKQGYVDHQQHDTLSILKTIETRFGLGSLNQFDANASSLASSFQVLSPGAQPHGVNGSNGGGIRPDAGLPTLFDISPVAAQPDQSILLSGSTPGNLAAPLRSVDLGRWDTSVTAAASLYPTFSFQDVSVNQSKPQTVLGDVEHSGRAAAAQDWIIPAWTKRMKGHQTGDVDLDLGDA